MHRSSASRLSVSIVSLVSVLLLGAGNVLLGADAPKKTVKSTVFHAVQVGVSPPLRTLKTSEPTRHGTPRVMPDKPPRPFIKTDRPLHDPLVQKTVGSKLIPDPTASFDGLGDVNGVQPADMGLDVSPTQVFDWVNLSFQVLDRNGNLLNGPFDGTAIWQAALPGSQCASNNGGDILVHWDQFASQWVIGQLAYPGPPNGYHMCIAVSQTSDATGSWFAYDYLYSATDLNDYPKFGLWPDPNNNGYYITARNFANASSFTGMSIMAIDRAAILGGNPGVGQLFNVGALAPNLDGLLPADLRGLNQAPAGSAETYIGYGNPATDGGPSSIHLFQTMVDFANPDNSTLTQLPDIPAADFDPTLINGAPQVGGGALETLSFSMYRADYRVFGDHDSLLLLHDVNVASACGGPEQGGERWHEVRGINVNGPPALYQEGTYGPCDGTYRWMGSIAQDAVGNIALGLSASSGGGGLVNDPSVHYTGRLGTDPLGTMTQGEGTFFDSTQPFGGFRWGDYSTIIADPVDQCTMWFSAMYGAGDWNTRIGSFKFPNCSTGPSGTLEGTVTDGANPIAGATVTAGLNSTFTDASGHYSFLIPVGTYSATASKFGYLPQTFNNLTITDGGDLVQDFVLAAAPSVLVNGTVKDGSGGGWPLYAKVVISAPGAPTYTVYTDPVTGYYSQTLVQGISWTFAVTAPGYMPGGGSLPLTPAGPVVENWTLNADVLACNAPGYSPALVGLSESFDAGVLPPGWQDIENGSTGPGWQIVTNSPCGDFNGNLTGGTGPFALVNSDCNGPGSFNDSTLLTPSIDLSTASSAVVRFNQDYFNLGDTADVDISTNGGSSWTNILEQTSDHRGPNQVNIDVTGIAAGQSDVQVRWHYYNAFWAWWWQVDDVVVGEAGCVPGAGGLIVGNVTSLNTGAGLNGATVANMTAGTTVKTFPTPADPNQPDGMYIMYSDSGSNDLQASLSLYGTDQHSVLVIPGAAVRQNFVLASGNVSADPTRVDGRVDPGGSQNLQLTLSNTGGAPANFQILELNAPALATHTTGFASEKLRKEALARLNGKAAALATTSKALAPLPSAHHNARPLDVGDVLASYPSGITYGWGVAASGADFWLSNLGVAGGDDKDYEYDSTTGAQTGNVLPDSFASAGSGTWAGDGAFDPITGTFWRVLVGGDNCIYEMNPSSGATGNKICGSPWTGNSQRGLAYDIVNNGFFIGGWNEGIVYHIDASGNVIDSANVGLPISGLAYSPQNGHLLVMSNQTGNPDVTVLDANNNYAVLGTFYIGGSSPVMTPFGQAGMEFDCAGNLWVIDQNTQTIYMVDSGENVACSVDIPWLSENPTQGTLAAGNGSSSSQPIALDFEGGTLLPGLRQAQLQVKTDTPVAVPAVPVTLTVRFLDVPDSNQFQAFIYGIAGAGVMFGGTPVCSDSLHFCPDGVVTRADMAGYLFRAIHGLNTPPPVYQNIFADVHFNDYNAFYIQGIYNDGITAGCGDGTIYCPNSPNTRAQMSVFIWKGQHGSTAPPACTGVFSDVPCPSLFADYIEGLYNEGVTAGCGGGNFCPNNNITNGQMAVFLVKGFNIPYLP